MSGGGQRRGRAKAGKPRPGTGGYSRSRLEGKGPTPPAELRPGHPAQRRAAAARLAAERGRGSYDRQVSGQAARQGGTGGPLGTRSSAGEYVAGRNPVLEALRAAVPATALHVGPRLDEDERIGQAVLLAADRGIPVVEAGRSELDRITGGAVHQGIALRIRRYTYAGPADLVRAARQAGSVPLIVALDGVTDPRNLGAAARSVAAFGGDGILVPARRSAGVTAGAWKASAGALARVPVARVANLAGALAAWQRDGLFVVGLDARGGEDIGGLAVADSPLVLVVGSEGSGLSRLVAQRCDVLARIPIARESESLNAGMAAAIALYAVRRLRLAAASADPPPSPQG